NLARIGSHPAASPFPYTTLFRSREAGGRQHELGHRALSGLARYHHVAVVQARQRARDGKPQADAAEAPGIAILGLHEGLEDAFRSEEHTSELQSRENLVCRLLLE